MKLLRLSILILIFNVTFNLGAQNTHQLDFKLEKLEVQEGHFAKFKVSQLSGLSSGIVIGKCLKNSGSYQFSYKQGYLYGQYLSTRASNGESYLVEFLDPIRPEFEPAISRLSRAPNTSSIKHLPVTGIRHGQETVIGPQGNLLLEQNWILGEKNGEHKSYYPFGNYLRLS